MSCVSMKFDTFEKYMNFYLMEVPILMARVVLKPRGGL